MEIKTNAKIRVRLESFNHELLVSSCQKIVNILQNTPLNSIGVVTLPTRKRIYCVLRSPHVDKDSREHFEIRIHKRILEIYYDSRGYLFLIYYQKLIYLQEFFIVFVYLKKGRTRQETGSGSGFIPPKTDRTKTDTNRRPGGIRGETGKNLPDPKPPEQKIPKTEPKKSSIFAWN
jgi:small subunit ribosomal protein S10